MRNDSFYSLARNVNSHDTSGVTSWSSHSWRNCYNSTHRVSFSPFFFFFYFPFVHFTHTCEIFTFFLFLIEYGASNSGQSSGISIQLSTIVGRPRVITRYLKRGVCADPCAAGGACAGPRSSPNQRVSRINPRDDIQWRGAPRSSRTLFFLLLLFFRPFRRHLRSPSFFFDFYYISPYRKPLVFRVERSPRGDVRKFVQPRRRRVRSGVQKWPAPCVRVEKFLATTRLTIARDAPRWEKWRSRRRTITRNEAWSILVTLLFDCSLFYFLYI